MSTLVWHAVGMHDVPDDDDWLDDVERARFARMSFAKRRSESRLGRWTAKVTLVAVLDLAPDRGGMRRVAVRNAPDGAPDVLVDGEPAGVVIGMTDRSDWAVCAVRSGPERIGCDLEVVEPRSPRFVEDYFTPREQRTVAEGDHDLLANLIWSAKESALKVLRTGLRRDTRSVEILLGSGTGEDWSPLRVQVADGARQWGWWIRFGDFVLTIAAATEIAEPQSLLDPPPLSSAVPSHRWMETIDDR